MARRPFTLPEVAEKLGVHYMTAYRYVRTGRLPARRVAGTWQIDSADLENMKRAGRGTRQRRVTGAVPARGHLEARLIASDESGAWDVLEAALGSGMEPEDVLLEILAPTMRSIGTMWELGELTVADEHRASSVAIRLISRLGARFGRRGHKRGTVILAAPPGELHSVPVALVANMLRWRGFAVVELGADTPADALAQTAAIETDLVAVGIAVYDQGVGVIGPQVNCGPAPDRPEGARHDRRSRDRPRGSRQAPGSGLLHRRQRRPVGTRYRGNRGREVLTKDTPTRLLPLRCPWH